MEKSEAEINAYFDKLLNKFKQDPQYELKQELGKLLMKHINDFTPAERARYEELKTLLYVQVQKT
jgi:hypothetical protein